MPIIASRSFATGNVQYLSLGPNEYLRTMSIGSNWTRIRIGILCSVSTVDETGWPVREAALCMGVCNTVKSSPSVLSAANTFGFGSSGPVTTASGSFLYNAGSSGNSYYTCGNFSFFKIEAGVMTPAGVGSFTLALPTNTTLGGALSRRGILIVDIAKSAKVSGNITQGVSCGAVAHMSLDLVPNDLYGALESTSAVPIVQGTALTNLAVGNSLAFNETTNGLLDTIFVYWNLMTVPLQLYEVAVYLLG